MPIRNSKSNEFVLKATCAAKGGIIASVTSFAVSGYLLATGVASHIGISALCSCFLLLACTGMSPSEGSELSLRVRLATTMIWQLRHPPAGCNHAF